MGWGNSPLIYMQNYTQQQIEDQMNPPNPLIVRFYHKPVVSEVIKGVNIYKPREMVEITVQGEKNTSLSKIATDQHRQEHAKEYQRFKSRLIEGLTPLCAITDQMTAQSLIDLGIKSVDDLAVAEPLPLFDELREQAKQLLRIKNAHTDRCEHHANQKEVPRATEESKQIQRQPEHAESGQQHIRSKEKENNQENNQEVIFEMNWNIA